MTVFACGLSAQESLSLPSTMERHQNVRKRLTLYAVEGLNSAHAQIRILLRLMSVLTLTARLWLRRERLSACLGLDSTPFSQEIPRMFLQLTLRAMINAGRGSRTKHWRSTSFGQSLSCIVSREEWLCPRSSPQVRSVSNVGIRDLNEKGFDKAPFILIHSFCSSLFLDTHSLY